MFLTRRTVNNYTFEGTKIDLRKGQEVIIPIYALQNDPNIFAKPEVFDPERFSAENIEKRNSIYHMPFGDGPRNCIGNLRNLWIYTSFAQLCFLFRFRIYDIYLIFIL